MTYKEKHKTQLLDPRWQKRRLEVLNNDNFQCQYCGNKEKTLHVHHFCYAANLWDSPDEDLVTLCSDCHKIVHIKTFTKLESDLISALQMTTQIGKKDDEKWVGLMKYINEIILSHK
jgi:5-methylcytosine-specific restriction endonuclease McrA